MRGKLNHIICVAQNSNRLYSKFMLHSKADIVFFSFFTTIENKKIRLYPKGIKIGNNVCEYINTLLSESRNTEHIQSFKIKPRRGQISILNKYLIYLALISSKFPNFFPLYPKSLRFLTSCLNQNHLHYQSSIVHKPFLNIIHLHSQCPYENV